jgi:hypothetical protein
MVAGSGFGVFLSSSCSVLSSELTKSDCIWSPVSSLGMDELSDWEESLAGLLSACSLS